MSNPGAGSQVPRPSGLTLDPTTLPHDSRGGVVVGTAVLMMFVGSVMVSLRIYTRYFIVGKLGMDDYLAISSLVFLFALGAGQIRNVHSGLGSHVYLLDIPGGALVSFLRDFWFSLLFYNIVLQLIKMTFLFQYYRVVAQVKKLRIVYLVAMVLIGCWSISQIVLINVLCVPIERFWDRSVEGRCVDGKVVTEVNNIGNIITDFIVLVLPLPVLLRLNLRPAQKWALVGVFSLGFFTCILSIIRRILSLFPMMDVTYASVDLTAWSIAEAGSGITCAALPTLKPLASRYMPAMKSTVLKYSGYQKSVSGNFTSSTRTSHRGAATPSKNKFYHSRQASSVSTWKSRTSIHAGNQNSDEALELSLRGGKPVNAAPHAADMKRPSWGPLNSNSLEDARPAPPSKDGMPGYTSDSSLNHSNGSLSSIPTTHTGGEGRWPSALNTMIVGGPEAAGSRPGSEVGLTVPRLAAIRVKRDVRIESIYDEPPRHEFI
ncbi:hypothetical protein F4778DRAFT_383664 [Xylariomycetidae sp. FL2044]|nr:hypothetical protein F4778DRAFT_383664 [Xylariomycetidae sp. FL2044]